MQNLTQLHHFRLVAREGSFARAAELANITQPALSNSIRSLERRLGFTLFERSERPVRMTASAKNILDRVEAILFEARNLDQTLDNLRTGQGGHIRIGMTAVFSTSEKLGDAFCHIPIYSEHMNLGFNKGTLLDDPNQLLVGTGKLIRHISVEKSSDYRQPEVESLLRTAIDFALSDMDTPP